MFSKSFLGEPHHVSMLIMCGIISFYKQHDLFQQNKSQHSGAVVQIPGVFQEP